MAAIDHIVYAAPNLAAGTAAVEALVGMSSLRSEIAKLRVSMVWMTVAVATGLGGLITVFEFLS